MVGHVENDSNILALGRGKPGLRGIIVGVGRQAPAATAEARAFDDELERRLLEIGFVEGAAVEILHEGFIGKDPIAVRVDDMSVALRRHEADAIMVRVTAGKAQEGGSRG